MEEIGKEQRPNERWEKSKSKAILRTGIINGTITAAMQPKEIREMDPEHKKWPYPGWRNNLLNLRKAIARERGRMAKDARDYGRDKGIVLALPKRNPTPWHQSKCPKPLQADIEASRH